jgi:GNAT superfamily N-acetyltransferase
MNAPHTPLTEGAITVARTSDTEWQAVADGRVLGSADAARRPDGRLFVSIDAWQAPVFDRLAETLPADLPGPLHTVVDETDQDTRAAWERAGFTVARRERGYLVPTDPQATGPAAARPPAGLTILPVGAAAEAPLRELADAVHAEVEATVGWHTMPAQILPCPAGGVVVDPARYAVAQQDGVYVGLLRLTPPPRRPRIGLLAVRAGHRRRGIARALLAHTLATLHADGIRSAWAEVDESNPAAAALFEGAGARHAATTLELVRR